MLFADLVLVDEFKVSIKLKNYRDTLESKGSGPN